MSVGASLLFLFLLAQDPRFPPDRLPRSEADVRGKVLEIHKETLREGHRAARGLLLIEQLPTPQQSAFHKVYVIVGEETRLFEMRGTEFESAEFDDLKVGQEIKAWVRGGMMHPVYPVRLLATAIAIIHPKPESEIFKISGTDRPH